MRRNIKCVLRDFRRFWLKTLELPKPLVIQFLLDHEMLGLQSLKHSSDARCYTEFAVMSQFEWKYWARVTKHWTD